MAAHHEAGHAVACVVLGVPFQKVRLDRNGLGGGAVVANVEQMKIRRRALQRKESDHKRIRRDIITVIAGPAAQERFNKIHGRSRHDPIKDPACENDWKLALLLATAIANPVKVDEQYTEAIPIAVSCVPVAQRLVAKHWFSVQAVARALLDRGQVSQAEVRQNVFDKLKKPTFGSRQRVPRATRVKAAR